MPSTYTLISSNVLSSSAASVTFSSIPATFTDLVLRISARGSFGSTTSTLQGTYNSSTTNYSGTYLEGYGAGTPSSGRNAVGTSAFYAGGITGAAATSNTFGSTEIYIPSYTVSQNKPASSYSVAENNTSVQYDSQIGVVANLWRDTTAISSITMSCNSGSFLSGSSFYLYGISKS